MKGRTRGRADRSARRGALPGRDAASIGLHEVGHLVPAKTFGVKVTQYMVGFGRDRLVTQRGETEYGVKAVPLGGY